MTGAACLAGKSALRMGVGLVTISSPEKVANVYRSFCPSLIVEERESADQFYKQFEDPRRNAILIGPGAGKDNAEGLRKAVLDSVQSKKICVLDADALTVFENGPEILLRLTHEHCIFTPHEGEFAKIFPDIKGDKAEKASQAAKISNAVIVLKGSETIIAASDGLVVLNTNGSPWLATAGTGDVLAGMIAGLCAWHAQTIFEAVCSAVWMHGEASQLAGAGMISADLVELIPQVWKAKFPKD